MSRRSLWRAGFRPCSAPVSTTSSSDLHIRAAVERQLAQMPHVMFGGLVHEPALTLARRLSAMLGAGLDHVFFSDSGSVAVEVALKMAAQYWSNRGLRRHRVIGFTGGYHGDTTGAMAVS